MIIPLSLPPEATLRALATPLIFRQTAQKRKKSTTKRTSLYPIEGNVFETFFYCFTVAFKGVASAVQCEK